MPAQRLPMRQVREVLRLKHAAGHSARRIAAAIGISRYTVAEYLRRATVVGITWPVPAELDDAALEARQFSPPTLPRTCSSRLVRKMTQITAGSSETQFKLSRYRRQ